MTTAGLVIPIEVAGRAGTALAGGKAVHLARVAAAGLATPPGIALTTRAYERFVAGGDLGRTIALELDRKPLADLRWGGALGRGPADPDAVPDHAGAGRRRGRGAGLLGGPADPGWRRSRRGPGRPVLGAVRGRGRGLVRGPPRVRGGRALGGRGARRHPDRVGLALVRRRAPLPPGAGARSPGELDGGRHPGRGDGARLGGRRSAATRAHPTSTGASSRRFPGPARTSSTGGSIPIAGSSTGGRGSWSSTGPGIAPGPGRPRSSTRTRSRSWARSWTGSRPSRAGSRT